MFSVGACGPVVPVEENTTDPPPCIDHQPSIEVETITERGDPVAAEVRYAIGDARSEVARFDGRVHEIWGAAEELVHVFATDGVCRFEADVIGASGCGDDPPARVQFVFDRFCGDPPSATGGAAPDDPVESSSGWDSGGDTGGTTGSASSSDGGEVGEVSDGGEASDGSTLGDTGSGDNGTGDTSSGDTTGPSTTSS
jgi:hypothetical protein